MDKLIINKANLSTIFSTKEDLDLLLGDVFVFTRDGEPVEYFKVVQRTFVFDKNAETDAASVSTTDVYMQFFVEPVHLEAVKTVSAQIMEKN